MEQNGPPESQPEDNKEPNPKSATKGETQSVSDSPDLTGKDSHSVVNDQAGASDTQDLKSLRSTSHREPAARRAASLLTRGKAKSAATRSRGRPRLTGLKSTQCNSAKNQGKTGSKTKRKETNSNVLSNLCRPVSPRIRRRPSARIAYKQAEEMHNSGIIAAANETVTAASVTTGAYGGESFVTQLKRVRAVPAITSSSHSTRSSRSLPAAINLSQSTVPKLPEILPITIHQQNQNSSNSLPKRKNRVKITDLNDVDELNSFPVVSDEETLIVDTLNSNPPASTQSQVTVDHGPKRSETLGVTATGFGAQHSQESSSTQQQIPTPLQSSLTPFPSQNTQQLQNSITQAVLSTLTNSQSSHQQQEQIYLSDELNYNDANSQAARYPGNFNRLHHEPKYKSSHSRRNMPSRGGTSNRVHKRLKGCEDSERKMRKALKEITTAMSGGYQGMLTPPTPPPSPLPFATYASSQMAPWPYTNLSQVSNPHQQLYHPPNVYAQHHPIPPQAQMLPGSQYPPTLMAPVQSNFAQAHIPQQSQLQYGATQQQNPTMPPPIYPPSQGLSHGSQHMYAILPQQQVLYSGQIPQQAQVYHQYHGPTNGTQHVQLTPPFPQQLTYPNPQYNQQAAGPQTPFFPPSQ